MVPITEISDLDSRTVLRKHEKIRGYTTDKMSEKVKVVNVSCVGAEDLIFWMEGLQDVPGLKPVESTRRFSSLFSD